MRCRHSGTGRKALVGADSRRNQKRIGKSLAKQVQFSPTGKSEEPSLEARLGVDVTVAADGLVHPLAKNGKPQGLSLNIDPKDNFIQQYGGAFPVNNLPAGLQAVPSGRVGHSVISPATPMSFARYQQLLNQVQLGNFNAIR